MALADQSLVKVEETADGEPRFRLLDTIREYAAERLEADGEADLIQRRHRDWYVALVDRGGRRAVGRRPAALARPARARARRHPGRPRPGRRGAGSAGRDRRRVLDVAVLAEARPPGRGAPTARGDGGGAVVARRPAPARQARWRPSAGRCWWQGDPRRWRRAIEEALEIWQTIGDEAEIANAYYNASFTYAVHVGFGAGGRRRRRPDRAALPRDGARHLPPDRRQARRGNALWGLGNYHYFRRCPGNGEEQFRETLTIFGEVGDRTMEAWALHMLGTVAAAQRARRRGAGATSRTRSATSMPPVTRRA